jgi:hypothetical protein
VPGRLPLSASRAAYGVHRVPPPACRQSNMVTRCPVPDGARPETLPTCRAPHYACRRPGFGRLQSLRHRDLRDSPDAVDQGSSSLHALVLIRTSERGYYRTAVLDNRAWAWLAAWHRLRPGPAGHPPVFLIGRALQRDVLSLLPGCRHARCAGAGPSTCCARASARCRCRPWPAGRPGDVLALRQRASAELAIDEFGRGERANSSILARSTTADTVVWGRPLAKPGRGTCWASQTPEVRL